MIRAHGICALIACGPPGASFSMSEPSQGEDTHLVFRRAFGDKIIMQPPYGCALEYTVDSPPRLRCGDEHERSLRTPRESSKAGETHRFISKYS